MSLLTRLRAVTYRCFRRREAGPGILLGDFARSPAGHGATLAA